MRNGVLPAPPAEMLPMLTTGRPVSSRMRLSRFFSNAPPPVKNSTLQLVRAQRAAVIEAIAKADAGAVQRAQRIHAGLGVETSAATDSAVSNFSSAATVLSVAPC